MPVHKRYSSSENLHDEDSLQQHFRRKQSRRDRGTEEEDEDEEEEEEEVREEDEEREGDTAIFCFSYDPIEH
ncbi:hypothetical protein Acr_13g0004380 [Actinidia rufa]|uniref:Uncharacterized protein n=1 Tax=Actinidia rufa TaxID=165716 RepID=A0A7J0FM76_9ERIC|nr:hypothetical protein Acr_13g0004380 [Actinidia rufa]